MKVQQVQKYRLKGPSGLGTEQGVKVVAEDRGMGMGTDCKWGRLCHPKEF